MARTRSISPSRGAMVLVLALLAWAPAARGGSDYSDKDFSVRFASAFIRFTEVSAGGGGSSASRWSSAINPASAGWLNLPSKLGWVVAPYYSHICFDAGTQIRVTGESVTWDTRKWGTFQPTMAQIRSNRDTNRQGLLFDYSVDTFQLIWAKRFGKWGAGANFNYAQAEVVHKMGPFRVSETHAESYRFRFGGLYEPAEKWLVGLTAEYGFAPYRATVFPMGPFGPAVRMRGTQQQYIVRPGVSYEYAKYSTAFIDYQYGSFFGKQGSLDHSHFSTGVNHRLLDWLFLRAGASLDARGNHGWNCGAGVYLSEWCGFDIGYLQHTLPELRPEFGRARILQFTFNLRF